MMDEPTFAVGFLIGIGRVYAYSWKDHILEIDHTYQSMHGQRAWGTTLCGRAGPMGAGRVYRGVLSLAPLLRKEQLCKTCKRVAERRLAA